ncbi:MAG: ATP-binding protein [bacterium]|nr:ATP-binding protein [bacterium]
MEKKAEKDDKKRGATGAAGHAYDASSITVLEGLEPVRKRPGMYIGTTGPEGLHHLIWEIFDNSRDEAMGGYADDIEVALLPDGYVRVVDNGRGVPVGIHPKTKVSALETIMTTLHAGGKFGGEDSGYKVSGGLHGVGASVVNALSIHTVATVHQDGGIHRQEYKIGKPIKKVAKIGTTKEHGTIIKFKPDAEIFKEGIEWNLEKIVAHLRQQAYLVKGVRITVIDGRALAKVDDSDCFYLRDVEDFSAPSTAFYFEGGLKSLVAFYNKHQESVHKNIFYVDKEADGVAVEVALQYVDDIMPRITAFANNTYNSEGGTHITGFKTALTRTLNAYGRTANLIKEKDENLTGDDVLEGITAVISVKLPEIQFEGQTKAKLGSMEAQGAVSTVFGEALSAFLEENPDDARSIINKVLLALKARKAAKAAKDSVLRKGALEGMTLPGKLADCQTKSAEEGELFIVEGDSAGGCFSGDTNIALTDGRNISFRELVQEHKEGKKNYCYTIGTSGEVEVGEIAYPRLTKKNTQVIQITLDNEEKIICTPDHRFMLRDGDFKEASALTRDDSLMPLNRQLSRLGKRITIKGYELVYTPVSHRWIFTHLLADNYNLANEVYGKNSGDTVHHKDFNKRNNNPDNLVRMNKQDHLLYHTGFLDKTLHSEETKEKARIAHASPAYREKISAIMSAPKMRAMLSKRAKKQWENEAYKKFMVEQFLHFRNTNASYRKETDARLNRLQSEYWARAENRDKQAERVRTYFEEHPELRREFREKANKQWADTALRAWRSVITKKQWTEEFREKRKTAYNATYLERGLKALHDIYNRFGAISQDEYNKVRKQTNDKTLLRVTTLRDRFFGGDYGRLEEAVTHYNHRISAIEWLSQTMDVYDMEVPGTHNFALASGVFVHNSSKQGRDRRTQAILPLRGKILNVERARIDRMLASVEIRALVIAMGTAIGDVFDLSKLRYHKIIIATDADVDGAHIRTLLLTLLYRHFRPIIDGGFVYIAQPPLYKITRGKAVAYAYSDKEKEAVLKELGVAAGEIAEITESESVESTEDEAASAEATASQRKAAKVNIQRYKGLGEMNPSELWETTMDPARRVLKRVNVDDAEAADRIFDILMGTDVASRKSFIQSNAKLANLDV